VDGASAAFTFSHVMGYNGRPTTLRTIEAAFMDGAHGLTTVPMLFVVKSDLKDMIAAINFC
jgi:hypothetical protein